MSRGRRRRRGEHHEECDWLHGRSRPWQTVLLLTRSCTEPMLYRGGMREFRPKPVQPLQPARTCGGRAGGEGTTHSARADQDFSLVRSHPASDGRERAANEAAARAVGESTGPPAREVDPAPEATRLLMNRFGTPPAGGTPVASAERVFFAPRFGQGVNDVRIHTDRTASMFANALGAEAFTRGSDIYFSRGRFAPASVAGKRLLAHELAHVTRDSHLAPQTIFRKTPAEEAEALAKTIHAALTGKATDEKAVLTALGSVNRDATKAAALKASYQKDFQTELEADLKAHLGADSLARALFLLNGPLKEAGTKTNVKIDAAGAEAHKAKVGGGDLSLHTGVDYTPSEGGSQRVGGFSVGVSTTGDAADTRFMPMIWAEIVATQPDKSDVAGVQNRLPTPAVPE